MSLFRPESLHSHRQSWLGSIQVMQPLGLFWLTLWALATLVVVSALFFGVEIPRRVALSGVLLPDRGLVRVTAPVAGTLATLAVREDDTVQAGQLLLTLREVLLAPGAGARTGVKETIAARTRSLADAARQAQTLLQLKQASAQERHAVLSRELAQWDTQARLHQQRLLLAQQALQRLQALQQQHFVAEAQVQAKQEDLLAQEAEGANIERQRQTLLRELRTLEAERQQAPLQTAQQLGELARASAELDETAVRAEALWSGQQRLEAPLAAQVSHLPVTLGQAVAPGEVLAWLTPAGAQLQAMLYAPSRAVGLLRAGQGVRLRVQAFAYQRYGWLEGHILRVAQAPAREEELGLLPSTPGAQREPLYRITVALSRQSMPNPQGGAALPLRAGMLLDADVALERRSLWAWAFEFLPVGR